MEDGERQVMTWKACKTAVILSVAVVALSGCRGMKNPFARNTDSTLTPGTNFGAPLPINQGGIESSVLPEPIRGQQSVESQEMKRIYFTFDSASLLEPAKDQLRQNAQWMQANPNVQIQIEGHCDSRGTADYNYSLGQRRADTARNYLIEQGINPGRLHTISYGADRPDDSSEAELAWARNRRVQFMVYN